MNDEFIQRQNKIRQDQQINPNKSPITVVLRKRSTKGIALLLVVAILAPCLVYYFTIDDTVMIPEDHSTCLVEPFYRVPCGNSPADLNYCYNIQCCFDNTTKSCFHTLPSNYYYFRKDKSERFQPSVQQSPFRRKSLENVQITVNEIDATSVQIILHVGNITVDENQIPDKNYTYTINDNPMYVEVFRKDSNQLLLSTAKGPTIISDKYWEWSFQLTDEYLFGLGDVLIETDNSTLTKVVYGNGLDHSTLPVFMAYKNGSYHGLVVHHDGPLEVSVLPSKLVILRSIFGNRIVLEVAIGPTVQEVVKQRKRTEAKPVDLWTLGVHLCREGTTTDLKTITDTYTSAKSNINRLRYESDCLHDNLLLALRNKKENTDTSAIDEAIANLISEEHRFLLSFPPQISVNSSVYHTTTDLDVFYKNNNTDFYQGRYKNLAVVYPFFGHGNIEKYTQVLFDDTQTYFQNPNSIEGYILGNNWPQDESYQVNDTTDFQYFSQELIEAMSLTLPWDIQSEDKLQISDHNNYGALQVDALNNISPGSFIMTASHNLATDQPIIIQNVTISWTNFKNAITTTLFNGVFGHRLISVPVCGSRVDFNSSFHEALCMRWYMMAATAPMLRISSDGSNRDPESLLSNTTIEKTLEAIDLRYQLRYYFYTILNRAEPVMRPMFYNFPDETRLFGLESQYMVGDYLLVAHPTLPDQSELTVYFPEGVRAWYDFWSGETYNYTEEERKIDFPIVETDWMIFMAGGGIIPFVIDNTTVEIIVNLRVVLDCYEGTNCTAVGPLMVQQYLFEFRSNETHLTVERTQISNEVLNSTLQEIKVYGLGDVKTHVANKILDEIDQSWVTQYCFDCNDN